MAGGKAFIVQQLLRGGQKLMYNDKKSTSTENSAMPGRKPFTRPVRYVTAVWAVALVLAIALTLMLLDHPAPAAMACVDDTPLVAV
jgi:hypothetical protein